MAWVLLIETNIEANYISSSNYLHIDKLYYGHNVFAHSLSPVSLFKHKYPHFYNRDIEEECSLSSIYDIHIKRDAYNAIPCTEGQWTESLF